MSLIAIESIIEYARGTEAIWLKTTAPVPARAAAYAIDTKTIRVGTGDKLYKDLPIAFSFDDLGKLEEFLRYFKPIRQDGFDKNKFVVVDAENNNFKYFLTPDELTSKTEALQRISQLAVPAHNHNDMYYTKNEIFKLQGSSGSALTDGDEFAMSYLIFDELIQRKLGKQHLPNGFCDIFSTSNTIDTTASSAIYNQAPGEGNNYYTVSPDAPMLVTASYIAPVSEVNYVYLCFKVGADNQNTNVKMYAEVSRDGGNTWGAIVSLNVIDDLSSKYWYGSCGFKRALDTNGAITSNNLPAKGTDIKVRIRTISDTVRIYGIRVKADSVARLNADKIWKFDYIQTMSEPVMKDNWVTVPAKTVKKNVTVYYKTEEVPPVYEWWYIPENPDPPDYHEVYDTEQAALDVFNLSNTGKIEKHIRTEGYLKEIEITKEEYIELYDAGAINIFEREEERDIVIVPEHLENHPIMEQEPHPIKKRVGGHWELPLDNSFPEIKLIPRL